jgi:hypothetical protein
MGARLLRPEEFGLLAGRFFEHASSQSLRRGVGHLLHLGQIDVQTWSLVPVSAAGNDFSPLFREVVDAAQVVAGQLPCGHVFTILGVRAFRQGEFLFPMLNKTVCGAKWFLHSGLRVQYML